MELSLHIEQFEDMIPDTCRAMTFGAYRHLLDLRPQPRHPDDGDRSLVRPIGIGASLGGTPVAFLLGEIPMLPDRQPEILSVYTAASLRNKGIATALVHAFEDLVTTFGLPRIRAVYMTGKPAAVAVQRVFEKAGWDGPSLRSITLRFAPDELCAMPWYGRVRLDPRKFEIFPWVELSGSEREEIRESHREKPWIRPGLEHWHHDSREFDEESSLGLRYQGRVLGWVINHRVQPDVLRYTCSFIRPDHGRRGRILPLFTESNERVRRSGTPWCSMIAPARFETMVRFVRRRMAPWVSFVQETREFVKTVSLASIAARSMG